MRCIESLKCLKKMPEKYNFTKEEREAFTNILVLCERRAREEQEKEGCAYYIGSDCYPTFADAMKKVEKTGTHYITERRTRPDGTMTTNKYKIFNGVVFGSREV